MAPPAADPAPSARRRLRHPHQPGHLAGTSAPAGLTASSRLQRAAGTQEEGTGEDEVEFEKDLRLKYHQLGGSVPAILSMDAAAAIAVTDHTVLFGTHDDTLHMGAGCVLRHWRRVMGVESRGEATTLSEGCMTFFGLPEVPSRAYGCWGSREECGSPAPWCLLESIDGETPGKMVWKLYFVSR